MSMAESRKILVTGSSGTIGTRLCETLIEKGYQVTGVDKKCNRWSEKVNAFTVIGDIRNRGFFKILPRDFDVIINLAANVRVYGSVKNPALARDNLEMLFNMLEFARIRNINKFIFASSREVYGNSGKVLHSEEEADIRNCESPYAASKFGGEALVRACHQCYGMNFVIVRFSNVYGMYDDSDRVIPLFIRLAKENRNLVVYGKEKLLDFTYIDDAISGLMKCLENFGRVKNDCFNITSGKGVSLLEIAQLIIKIMNAKNKIIVRETRKGEVTKFIADISKARQRLSFKPKIQITKGIRKTIDWYLGTLYGGEDYVFSSQEACKEAKTKYRDKYQSTM